MPRMTNGNCHAANLPRNVSTPASAAARLPSATLINAITPGSNAIFFGAGTPVTLAAAARFAFTSASDAAARLAICSSIARTTFLYGDQNAWRRLIGLDKIFVIVASKSRPVRS